MGGIKGGRDPTGPFCGRARQEPRGQGTRSPAFGEESGVGGMGSGKLVRAREALGAHRANFVHVPWSHTSSRTQKDLLLA